MSLINNMLHNLEDRQALVGTYDNSVIGDLESSYELHARDHYSSHWMAKPLFFITVFISFYLLYVFYFSQGSIKNDQSFENIESSGNPHYVNSNNSLQKENETNNSALNILKEKGIALKLSALKRPLIQTIVQDGAEVADSSPLVEPGFKALTTGKLLDIGLTELAGATAIRFRLSKAPDYSLFVLERPDRLLVEIKDLEFTSEITSRNYENQIIKGLRTSYRNETALLIFDLKGAFEIAYDQATELDNNSFILDLELISIEQQRMVEPVKAKVVAEANIRKTISKKNPTDYIDKIYKDGVKAYRSGDITRAIDLLYQVLSNKPAEVNARKLLVGILLEQSDKKGAKRVLLDGIHLLPGDTVFISQYAKLLFEEGHHDTALAYMKQANPVIESAPEYYALMAAILQRKKNYHGAAQIYKNLVRVSPDNGIWWMGLGISMEGIGSDEEALKAYWQARVDKNLPVNISQYIKKRIEVISGS